ncbi:MAG: hypothetical protein ACSLFI_01550 [Solirubrobacterales bacterium]
MTEPQVWVLIGVFAAAVFGMLTWQTISFNRTLSAVADRLEAKIDGKIDGLRHELSTKIDNLNRDVEVLSRHVFGTDPR